MQAITYENTATTLPRWDVNLHNRQSRGYAYRDGPFNFHFYGTGEYTYAISPGLTASERTELPVKGWALKTFGAKGILSMQRNVGEVVAGVWRPGLWKSEEIYAALEISEHEARNAEQGLRILVEKLDEILLYIEPSEAGLQTYGHKTRELLILACTEVENCWVQYLALAGQATNKASTNQYVKLHAPLHLSDYEVSYPLFNDSLIVRPFATWDAANPTTSLLWYDAYNRTKHNRTTYFHLATLENCLHAVAAVVAMFCARYSPFPLINGASTLSVLVRQHMNIKLRDPDPTSFYVPLINRPSDWRAELMCVTADQFIAPYTRTPLIL
ncbi:hypothetical protein QZM62_10965 [Burkholderia multivorans]|nr:hypothetical protein [Burkholderia multivorans]